jgi:hypothetical protein
MEVLLEGRDLAKKVHLVRIFLLDGLDESERRERAKNWNKECQTA